MSSSAVPQVFLILLFFSQVMCMSTNKNAALLQQVCEKTSNSSLCVSSLESDPRTPSADLKTLVEIMIDVTIVKATKIIQLIVKLNQTTTDPVVHSCFNLCSLSYEAAVGDLQKAIHAFELSSYEESGQYISFSTGAPEDCEDVFVEPPARKSPLTAIDANFISLILIAKDILSIFQKNKSP